MTEHTNPADAMRDVGLFELHDSLASLLREVAVFLEKHRIAEVVDFSQRHEPSRGWQAELELHPADFLRVLSGYPMPIQITPQARGGALLLQTDLRAATVSATLPLNAVEAYIQDGALVIGRAS
jgi:hypothetical protein